MFKKLFLALPIALFPSIAFAGMTLSGVINKIIAFFQALIPVLISIAVLVFFWGIVKFIGHADDERAVAEGKMYMVWGMVGIFVIVGLWAIVGYIQSTFGLGVPGALGNAPGIPIGIPVR